MKKVWWAAVAAATFALPAMAKEAGAKANEISWHTMTERNKVSEMFTVQAEAGVGAYGQGLGDSTGIGYTFAGRIGADVFRGFGIEGNYNLWRTPLTDPRLEQGAALWRNGISGLVKAYAPLEIPARPYIGTGYGLSYVRANSKGEGLYRNDWQSEFPIAAGVQVDAGPITAGIRGTYGFLAGVETNQNATVRGKNGSLLQGALNIGGRF